MQGKALALIPTVSTLTLAPALLATASPDAITTDGVNLYVADMQNSQIHQIVIATGVITTFVTPTLWAPAGITTDGTNLYVADLGGCQILQIAIVGGAVTTLAGQTGICGFADGVGTLATFNWPQGITTDGSNLYVTDTKNHKIRQIVIAGGVVGTVTSLTGIAGTQGVLGFADGAVAGATFNFPAGITTDGVNLYVADTGNHKIRKIDLVTKMVTSLTGVQGATGAFTAIDGVAAVATFYGPTGITTDGTNLYVVDTGNNKIRKVVIATGAVTSVTGAANTAIVVPSAVDGTGASATFNFSGSWNFQAGITSDGTSLYVADPGNAKIRKIQ